MSRFAAIALSAAMLINAEPLPSGDIYEPDRFEPVFRMEQPAQEDAPDSEGQEAGEGGAAAGEPVDFDAEMQTTLDALDLMDMETLFNGNDLMAEAGYMGLREMVSMAAKGELPMDAWDILKLLLGRFFKDMQSNSAFMIKIIVLAIIASLLGAIGPQNMSGEISKLCSMVIYLVVAALIAQSMVNVMQVGNKAITAMTAQMEAIFPVMITLLVAMGGAASAGIFQPAMVLLTGAVGTFIQKVILPLVLVYGVLTLVKNTSDRVQIKGIAGLVKKSAQWLLGAVFVVFLGVTALQGLGGSAYDGVTIRTAKFAIDKMVPIVGGMFSDTVDTLIGCSLVVKNGVGIVGLIMIASTALMPVLNIAAMSFVYKLAAALVEPFGEKHISGCLSDMGSVFTLMYVVVLTVGAMMFIMISLMINAGNMNVMLR